MCSLWHHLHTCKVTTTKVSLPDRQIKVSLDSKCPSKVLQKFATLVQQDPNKHFPRETGTLSLPYAQGTILVQINGTNRMLSFENIIEACGVSHLNMGC